MTVTTITLEGNVQWRVARSSTSERWIGICDPMNLSVDAVSLDELNDIIKEAIQLLLVDLLLDNELDRFLRERGWIAHNLPRDRTDEDVEFKVPLELLVSESTGGSERRPH